MCVCRIEKAVITISKCHDACMLHSQSVSSLTYCGKCPDHDAGECPDVDGAERPGHWWSNSCLVWLSRLLHGCIHEYKSLVILYIAILSMKLFKQS